MAIKQWWKTENLLDNPIKRLGLFGEIMAIFIGTRGATFKPFLDDTKDGSEILGLICSDVSQDITLGVSGKLVPGGAFRITVDYRAIDKITCSLQAVTGELPVDMGGRHLYFAFVRDSRRGRSGPSQTSLDELRIHATAKILEQNKRDPGYQSDGYTLVEAANSSFAIGDDVGCFAVNSADEF